MPTGGFGSLEGSKTPGYIVALFGLLEAILPFLTGTTSNALVLTLGVLTLLGGLGMATMAKWGYILAFFADVSLITVTFAVSYNVVELLLGLILLFYLIYVAKNYGFAKKVFRPKEAHYVADAEMYHKHYVED
jgi:predicted membrane protein